MTATPYVPDVTAIAADLAAGHVHLDASVNDQVTPEQLATITTSINASPVPIYVIAVPYVRDAPLSPVQLISLVHRELPEDGIWYVAQQKYDKTWDIASTTYGVSVQNADALAGYVARDLYPSDLGLQLQKIVDLIATGTAKDVYYSTLGTTAPDRTTTQQDDGAQVLGIDAPLAYTGLGVLALIVAVIAVRRRPRPGREVAVKDRALRRISAAQTQSWRHRAEQEAAALGLRINDEQIADGSDPAAWTAALDHYEAANRVLDRTTSAAHSIGALVLARRGDDALDHAVAGRPWSPTVVCFFNPLHGPGTTTATWRTAAGAREVPACNACRRLVGKKKEPDFLDLPVDDTVVHYVDADAEPWSSTGYGSLDPDLLARAREIR